MSKEFRPIEKAPLYEMDKDGNIQTINKKTPAIPYPIGSKNVILKLEDGRRVTFKLDDLFQETFGEKVKPEIEQEVEQKAEESEKIIPDDETILTDEKIEEIPVEQEVEKSERAMDTEQMPSSGKITSIKKEKKVKVIKEKKDKKVKEERKVSSDNPIIKKIMALDCFESIKMWKLHEAGISDADITILVNDPHDFVVVKTLEKYKKNETLRSRADKVKV